MTVRPKHLKCEPSIFPSKRCIFIPRALLNGAQGIVLARWSGMFRPFRVCLPHQIYVDELPLLMDGCPELWALPIGVEGRWFQVAGPNPGATHPRADFPA